MTTPAPTYKVVTNYIPRYTVDGFDLPTDVREDFDYMEDIDSANFILYKGMYFSFDEVMRLNEGHGFGDNWHGIISDSSYSLLVRLVDDCTDSVVIATVSYN